MSHECRGWTRRTDNVWKCIECNAVAPSFRQTMNSSDYAHANDVLDDLRRQATRHVITADEKSILDAAIAFVTEGDDLESADELYFNLEQAVAKVVTP